MENENRVIEETEDLIADLEKDVAELQEEAENYKILDSVFRK